MPKIKVLNIIIGKMWDPDKKVSRNVTAQAFEQTSKKTGKKYYSLNMPIFVAEIEKKDNAAAPDADPVEA